MGYDITLKQDGQAVSVPAHTEGGQYMLDGVPYAYLYVTYNYAPLFRFRDMDGKVAKDTVETLQSVVAENGTERDDDYWEPTPGNVGHAASILLAWAEQCPDATWSVE